MELDWPFNCPRDVDEVPPKGLKKIQISYPSIHGPWYQANAHIHFVPDNFDAKKYQQQINYEASYGEPLEREL